MGSSFSEFTFESFDGGFGVLVILYEVVCGLLFVGESTRRSVLGCWRIPVVVIRVE